jgi:D-aminoacyl-tRNA deacylase
MRAVVQRAARGEVRVHGAVVGSIERGLVVLLGVVEPDTAEIASRLAAKIAALRIFPDDAKPMNRSVVDIGGAALVVSQFTLVADTNRGNRPSFTTAAAPAHAKEIYDAFVAALRVHVGRVACGEFGADMQVELVNDGPVTFVLDAS